MKKSLFHLALTLCIGLFAACSQEDVLSPSNGGEETVSVSAQLPGSIANTRALPGAAADHQLRCILEVWDKADNGQLITRIEKLASEATDGKLSFAFTVPTATNYQCLLWADFVATDAGTSTTGDGNTLYTDKYYTTTNLKAIDFKATDAALFNNVSTDAFCGVVDKNGTTSTLSVTLKRPFTKVTLKDNSDYINDCASWGVEYNTPSGYNIATGLTTATKPVKATGLTSADKTWFSTFIFASADKNKLDQDIKMEIVKTDNTTETKTIKAGQISLDSNVENNADANFAAESNVLIDVNIDGEYPDPNAPKIGYFVNKDGSCTAAYNAENAIGIVFAVGAKGDDTAANYGNGFTGKTIYGYAMALTSVTRSYLGEGSTDANTPPVLISNGTTPYEENDYNGYTYSAALLTSVSSITNSVLFKGYDTWKEKNTFDNSNLSSWYIPSGTQTKDICCMLFGLQDEQTSSKNNDFIAAYETVITAAGNRDNVIDFGKDGVGAAWILSSYVNETAPAVMMTNVAESAITSVKTNTPAYKIGNQYVIRPVLTIFKP